jgi:hypothetical protein
MAAWSFILLFGGIHYNILLYIELLDKPWRFPRLA